MVTKSAASEKKYAALECNLEENLMLLDCKKQLIASRLSIYKNIMLLSSFSFVLLSSCYGLGQLHHVLLSFNPFSMWT